jgi:hypothetical protein
MRIPLIAGREFNERDTAESDKVMIVNEKMARRLWPNQNAIGQVAMVSGDRRVVGIVGNVRHQALEQKAASRSICPSLRPAMARWSWWSGANCRRKP